MSQAERAKAEVWPWPGMKGSCEWCQKAGLCPRAGKTRRKNFKRTGSNLLTPVEFCGFWDSQQPKPVGFERRVSTPHAHSCALFSVIFQVTTIWFVSPLMNFVCFKISCKWSQVPVVFRASSFHTVFWGFIHVIIHVFTSLSSSVYGSITKHCSVVIHCIIANHPCVDGSGWCQGEVILNKAFCERYWATLLST